MSSSKADYVIVGAGVFGVSTAYTLIQKYPNASVTLVDRDAYDAESRVAASWDWNKERPKKSTLKNLILTR